MWADSIEAEEKEKSDIERDIRHLRNDVIKLNTLLHKEKGEQDRLEASNALQEGDFIKQLKVCFSHRQCVSKEVANGNIPSGRILWTGHVLSGRVLWTGHVPSGRLLRIYFNTKLVWK